MNKEHSYRGFKFNIKVELDHTVEIEKSLDGLRTFQHKIILNDMGETNYYNTEVLVGKTTPTILSLRKTEQSNTSLMK